MTDLPEPSNYNPIFERLVDSSEGPHGRLQGFVAYGLYKTSKREWASDIRGRHSRGPTADELESYVATWTLSRLDGLRIESADILAQYADFVIADAKPRILREAVKGSFWRSFWSSVLATVFFSVVVVVLGVILAWQGVDVFGAAVRQLSQ